MNFRIGVIADLHLPKSPDTVKERVFDWALAEARKLQLDYLVGAGDLTAAGAVTAAERIIDKLSRTGIPFCLTPGNAELRSRNHAKMVAKMMKSEGDFFPLVPIDTARRKIAAEDLLRLKSLEEEHPERLIVTHCPPECLPMEDQKILESLFRERKIGGLVAGHLHIDAVSGGCTLVRGLDPDKAAGGPPAMVILDCCDSRWRRINLACPEADPRRWPEEVKKEFSGFFGFSGMSDPMTALRLAAERHTPVFEFRFSEVNELSRGSFSALLGQWREAGGKILSCLLPTCSLQNGRLSGVGRLQRAINLAMANHCDRVTLKIPEVSCRDMAEAENFTLLTRELAEILKPLAEQGCTIGFENRHILFRRRPNESRDFGCLPEECISWLEGMREALPGISIGLHLDLGSARNNAPFANRYTLSQWYELTGKYCVGYHFHQVLRNSLSEPMRTHAPLLTVFGRLLSLSSFFMAWQAGIVRHAPVILEIRDGGGPESYNALCQELGLPSRQP